MLIPDKGNRNQHLPVRFKHPFYLGKHLIDVKYVLKHFKANDRIEMTGGEGKGFAVVKAINLAGLMVVSGYFYVNADITRSVNK